MDPVFKRFTVIFDKVAILSVVFPFVGDYALRISCCCFWYVMAMPPVTGDDDGRDDSAFNQPIGDWDVPSVAHTHTHTH